MAAAQANTKPCISGSSSDPAEKGETTAGTSSRSLEALAEAEGEITVRVM